MSEYRDSGSFQKEDYEYIERGDSSWSVGSLAGMAIVATLIGIWLLAH